jgi:hypothetical protein
MAARRPLDLGTAWADLPADERRRHLEPLAKALGVDPSRIKSTGTVKTIFVTPRWRDEYRGRFDDVIVVTTSPGPTPVARSRLEGGRPARRSPARSSHGSPSGDPDEPEPPLRRRSCERCGGVIEQPSTGRPRRHCSNACKQVAYRQRVRRRREAAKLVHLTPRERSRLADKIARERLRRAGGFAAVERQERGRVAA